MGIFRRRFSNGVLAIEAVCAITVVAGLSAWAPAAASAGSGKVATGHSGARL